MSKKRKVLSMALLYCAIVYLGVLPASSYANPTQWQEYEKIQQIFINNNITGTFVLYTPTANTFTGYNQLRAETRFVPGSTFKIPNTLIGLFTKKVHSVDEVLPYGGNPQPFAMWEKDMSLRQAIKVSNIPVYQGLARRIGLVSMANELLHLNYGNNMVGSTVDNFWLRGPLAISAIEQTQFLANLATNKLPVSIIAQKATQEIVKLEHGAGWVLYGKTGTVTTCTPTIQWWVGWVIKENIVYSFALNMDVPTDLTNTPPDRITIGKACLQALGVL